MKRFFVTGGAGFIGSHVVDMLLAKGFQVVAFDNLETGHEFFLEGAKKNSNFKFVKGDLRKQEEVVKALRDFPSDWIIHLAANADVRRGSERPTRDLEYNTVGTANVLEALRINQVKNILFSSTGSVYGEPEVFPTPETAPFPEQTSLYGASKLAGEAMISAYSHAFGIRGVVFRFVSILGPRYTHGHVFDFIKKLKSNSAELDVLGDGKQLKSYLHVEDLMKGLWKVIESPLEGFQVYNIGHDDALQVDQSIGYITAKMNLSPKRNYAGGVRGWVGDSPRIQLDCSKLKKLGWKYEHSLQKGVEDTVEYLLKNSQLLEEHS
jgi:UDP-glucose 4-epimerase